MGKGLTVRWIVTLLLLLIFLCTVKTAECRVQAVEEGAYTLSVSCTVDIGYEETENIVERVVGVLRESELGEMSETEVAETTGSHAWKVNPVFAVCGIGLIIGGILVLIGCIRARQS